MLGFKTHKMNISYQPPSPYHTSKLVEIMEQFCQDQDYDAAIKKFENDGWLGGCPPENLASLKTHVIKIN